MIRKHAASTLLAAIALQASLAHGLGLGDITLRSALDQPLAAEIRLRGVGDLNPSQILVGLGSAGDFERAGVERVYMLSDIQFEVQLDGEGNGVVRLSSDGPIREPYLDFVVEVRWPTGRVLREYTVLLDLPTYSAAAAEPVTAARAQPFGATVAAGGDDGGLAMGSGEHTVGAGQTLWSIANRAKPAGVSTQQMMVAIQRANPEAFINGNMNLLRSGAVLRMPEGSDLVALSRTEARRAVAQQTSRSAVGGAPAAAPEAPPAAEAGAAAPEGEGYLALAGDTAGQPGVEAAGGVGEAGGSAGADADLSAVQESLSAAERANAELQARVAALEAQVKDYEKLAQLKSDTLSGAQQAAGEEAAPAAEPAAEATPAQAATPPATPEPGVVERLLGNTMALVAALVALLLAMLFFLFKRRRTVEEFVPAPERPLRPAPAPVLAEPRKETPRAADLAPSAVAAAPAAAEVAGTELADPVGEAEIYLAYGRQERAIEILRDALHGDPGLSDVRLKLMEIHDERGEQQEFMHHYARLGGDARTQQAARDLLEHGKNPQWLAVLTTGAAALAAVGIEPRLDREHELALDLDAELKQAGTSAAPEQEFELGGLDDADLDALAAAAAAPPRSQQEAMLAKTEQAIARAAAELDLGAEQGGADFAGFELDVDQATSGELPEFDLPGELELDLEPGATGLAQAEDADLAFLKGTDETETKLELARAYVDMGDLDGARDILEEVAEEGSVEQREQAAALLGRIRPS
jgi:pilus assembly protein FimV